MSAVAQDGRRAVGARNAEAILEAAVRVLGTDANAGMAEIATAAGVGRATLYRHFGSRERLIEALLQHVGVIWGEGLAALAADSGDPEAALRRLVEHQLSLRDRYRVLAPFVTPEQTERKVELMWAPLATWVERAVAAGLVASELPASWVAASLRAHMRAAGEELDAGRLARADAAERIVRAVLRGAAR